MITASALPGRAARLRRLDEPETVFNPARVGTAWPPVDQSAPTARGTVGILPAACAGTPPSTRDVTDAPAVGRRVAGTFSVGGRVQTPTQRAGRCRRSARKPWPAASFQLLGARGPRWRRPPLFTPGVERRAKRLREDNHT